MIGVLRYCNGMRFDPYCLLNGIGNLIRLYRITLCQLLLLMLNSYKSRSVSPESCMVSPITRLVTDSVDITSETQPP